MKHHKNNPVTRAADHAAQILDRLFADVEHDSYTSMAPRRPDGSHVRPFPFNSNGS